MAEFDDKLNSILSNPDAMAQIMQLAQSLGGPSQGETAAAPAPQPPPAPPSPPLPAGGSLLSALDGGLDPQLLSRLLPLVQELGGAQDSNARQLLYALRPYLKHDRQEKIERALQLARLFLVGKKLLKSWEGGHHV